MFICRSINKNVHLCQNVELYKTHYQLSVIVNQIARELHLVRCIYDTCRMSSTFSLECLAVKTEDVTTRITIVYPDIQHSGFEGKIIDK